MVLNATNALTKVFVMAFGENTRSGKVFQNSKLCQVIAFMTSPTSSARIQISNYRNTINETFHSCGPSYP